MLLFWVQTGSDMLLYLVADLLLCSVFNGVQAYAAALSTFFASAQLDAECSKAV